MYGTELGSVIRYRRSKRPTPNERAVSSATGSTSRTPYIVWIKSGQNAPNVARKTSLLSVRPERQEEQRDQRGGRDRPQELDRDAERARGEVARAEDDPDRDGEHGREREAEGPAADGVARTRDQKWLRLHQRPQLAEARAHRGQVALRDRRPCARPAPRRRAPMRSRARRPTVSASRTRGEAPACRNASCRRGRRVHQSRHADLSEADARRDLVGGALQRGREPRDEVVQRDQRAVHGEVDRGDDVAGLRRAPAPRSSAGRTRAPRCSRRGPRVAHPFELLDAARFRAVSVFGPRCASSIAVEHALQLGSSGRNASSTLPIDVQYAGRREPTWRLRSISRWPCWALRQRSM